MLGSCNCSFKSESNLFRGGAFSFVLSFIVLTRFSLFFSFLRYLRYVKRRI